MKHTNPQLQGCGVFLVAEQPLRWPGWSVALDNCVLAGVALYKAIFSSSISAPSDVGVRGRRGCPHAINQETKGKGSDSNTPGGKSNNQIWTQISWYSNLGYLYLLLTAWWIQGLARPWENRSLGIPAAFWERVQAKPVPDILEWKLLSFEPQLFHLQNREGSCPPYLHPPPPASRGGVVVAMRDQ